MQHENIAFTIVVTERWYVFPKPYFDLADRNFNVWWVEYDHDFSRTEYGVDLVWYNFTGNRDIAELKAIFGYAQKLELFYERPQLSAHTAFGGGFFAAVSNNKQIAYTTINNKLVFTADSFYIRSKFRAGINIIHRDNQYNYQQLQFKYNYHHIADSVSALNTDYFLHKNITQQFFSVQYTFTRSNVDNRSYPLKGTFIKMQAAKTGLGIFHDINQLNITAQFNKYVQLIHNVYIQGEVRADVSLAEDYPYFNLLSLGYCENFVRGFEYYVIDGEQTYLFRSNIKTRILKTNVHSPVIRLKQFDNIPFNIYFKLFCDAGYVHDFIYNTDNPLTNTFICSAGAGVDITTYYDWVMRIEGTLNSLGETGLFLHLALDLNTFEYCNIW